MKKTEKCFFTIAIGNKYLQFAYTLARSYFFHNGYDIHFYIISNKDFSLPYDLKKIRKFITPALSENKGAINKLYFDQIVPSKKSIFLDADSLIYGNIAYLFEFLNNDSISVIGTHKNDSEWVGLDVTKTQNEFGINQLIRYCGAFYYIILNQKTNLILEKARNLNNKYKFQKHRQSTNEEPILSIAMSQSGVLLNYDDGSIWGDISQFENYIQLNTLNSFARLNNSPGPKLKYWLPLGVYAPKIVHMGGGIYFKNPWIFDHFRLLLYSKFRIGRLWSDRLVNHIIIPIYFLLKKIKSL